TADQAATYSEVRHYLKAVAAARSLDPGPVLAKMRELPVNDAFATDGHLREDGQMVHNLYLVRVKAPAESKEKGDYLAIVQEFPGEEVFQTFAESGCSACEEVARRLQLHSHSAPSGPRTRLRAALTGGLIVRSIPPLFARELHFAEFESG